MPPGRSPRRSPSAAACSGSARSTGASRRHRAPARHGSRRRPPRPARRRGRSRPRWPPRRANSRAAAAPWPAGGAGDQRHPAASRRLTAALHQLDEVALRDRRGRRSAPRARATGQASRTARGAGGHRALEHRARCRGRRARSGHSRACASASIGEAAAGPEPTRNARKAPAGTPTGGASSGPGSDGAPA